MGADMSRSVLVNLELIGLRAPARRLRPVAAVPFALVSVVVALLPIRPSALWMAAVVGCNLVPWLLGLRERRPGRWRLSERGLEHLAADGEVREAYELTRVEEFAVTADDGMLTIFHRFGATDAGRLEEMGFDPLTFYLTARRLGITTHVIDGDRSVFEDDNNLPPEDETPRALGRRTEQRLRDQEAALLALTHEPRTAGRTDAVRLTAVASGRRRTTALGFLVTLLSLTMVTRIALAGGSEAALAFGSRLMGGLWALVGSVALVAARRRRLRGAPLSWTITPTDLRVRHSTVGEWRVRGDAVAAAVVGPGSAIDPVSGRPAADETVVTLFGHRLDVLARLPARGLDAFQLTHALDERGYHVVTPDQGAIRPSEYGLAGLPEIFSQVPGGRLVVDDDGIGWADGAGDIILRMPRDRIGGMELLTVDGHAWLRMYDDEGDEFLAAPLAMLRISRTDLRDAARRVQLPITDAEYDAYVNAAFYGSMTRIETAEPVRDKPKALPAAQLDVPPRTRALAYAVTATLCELVAVLGSLWLSGDFGGFWTALAWAAPSGLVLGVAGAWLYDRNRPQLRVSASGISSVTRLGRTEWSVTRQALGGVGIDEAEAPRLVVWSPAGRVLRRVSFPPDLTELRRACERHGLPWGPPDAGHGAAPPPEL
jgi:hypothetical protein